MFYVIWNGTVAGCEVTTSDGTTVVVNQTQYDTEYATLDNPPACTEIPAQGMVNQTTTYLEGETICGMRGGDPFVSASLLNNG